MVDFPLLRWINRASSVNAEIIALNQWLLFGGLRFNQLVAGV